MLVYIVLYVQVILQTYIEYLRGKVDDKKEMNHHGKTIVVDTATKVEPLEYVTDLKKQSSFKPFHFRESQIRSINEQVQQRALKNMYDR